MTSATEKLRRLLDERGVEWTENDCEHVKETCWPYMGELMAAFAEYDNGTTRFACDTWCFTPEQAIAATLGCKLTVEQVREAIFKASTYASYDGAKYYADGISMQAIAYELNAVLGARVVGA